MLCPNCETGNREGAKFCDECGFPLAGGVAASALEADSGATAAASSDALPEDATAAIEPIAGGSALDREHAHDEAAGNEAGSRSHEGRANGGSGAESATNAPEAPEAVPVDSDFAGLDMLGDEYGERVVDPGYHQPQANWRDGNTMQMPPVDGEEAPRSRDYLASSTTVQKKGRKKAIAIIAAVIVVAAVAVFATYHMQLWGGKVVPDVRGMTEADAASVLEGAGFQVRSSQVKSDDTEGLVLITDPTGGARTGEGEEIVIHVATAREIPDVIGKTEADAKAAFEEAGYENVTYTSERSDEPEATVLSVSPEVGTRAKSTIAVTVTVAEPFTVPDTSALSLEGAIDAIGQAGLAFDVLYIDTQEYADGSVMGTNPEAGTKVKSDTTVVIEVARARGAQLVQLTRNLLSPGTSVNIDGVSYEIESLESAEYIGDDTVSFSIIGRPFTYFMGQYISLDSTQASGYVSWTADNGVAGIYS